MAKSPVLLPASEASHQSSSHLDRDDPSREYVYTALDREARQFRILQLEPGAQNDIIRGSLVVHPVADGALERRRVLRYEKTRRLREHWDAVIDSFSNAVNDLCEAQKKWVFEGYLDHYRRSLNRNWRSLRRLLDWSVHRREDAKDEERALALAKERTPSFEAVSYHWRNPSETTTIMLDDRPYMVQADAVKALQGLRSLHEVTHYWIDAICINQRDLDERAQQVTFMADIYGSASHVYVWLNETMKEATESIAAIKRIAVRVDTQLSKDAATAEQRASRKGHSDLLHSFYWRTNDEHFWSELNDTDVNNYGMAAATRELANPLGVRLEVAIMEISLDKCATEDTVLMKELYHDAWFSRLWVQQEAQLARNCTCVIGQERLPWSSVLSAAVWFKLKILEVPYTLQVGFNVMDELRRTRCCYSTAVRLGVEEAPHILTLLLETSDLRASDPRDKIYSLLGMTSWVREGLMLPKGLQPDYRKSVRDCYRDATRVGLIEPNLNGPKPLDLLVRDIDDYPVGLNPSIRDWPSWTIKRPLLGIESARDMAQFVDWTTRAKSCKEEEHQLVARLTSRLAASETPGRHELDEDLMSRPGASNDSLFLRGHRMRGRILAVSSVIVEDRPAESNGETRDQETIQSSIDTVKLNFSPSTSPSSFDDIVSAVTTAAACISRKDSNDEQLSAKLLVEKSRFPRERIWYRFRRWFIVGCIDGEPHLGLGTDNMRIGDVVAALFGCSVLLVLRPRQTWFTIVGTAFIPGMMPGQLVHMYKAMDVEPTVFEIR